MRALISSWISWFYEPLPAATARVFGFCIGVMTLIHVCLPISFLGALLKTPLPAGQWYLVTLLGSGAPGFWLVFAIGVIGSGFLIFGRYTQIGALLAFFALTALVQRFPEISYGGYQFLRPVLLYACFTSLSLRKPAAGLPVRGIQLFIAVIYFISALMKLRSADWMGGLQMENVLNTYGTMQNFTWIAQVPIMSVFMGYVSIAAELCFPFLVWFPRTRRWALIAIALLHLSIFLTMNVTFFSETMLALITIFLSANEANYLLALPHKILKRIPKLAFR